MFLLSSWAFEREIIEVERCDHLLARLFLANLLRFVAENYEFATHRHSLRAGHSRSTDCTAVDGADAGARSISLNDAKLAVRKGNRRSTGRMRSEVT